MYKIENIYFEHKSLEGVLLMVCEHILPVFLVCFHCFSLSKYV